MSASCFFKNYTGPDTSSISTERPSKGVKTNIIRNPNGPRNINSSIDCVDALLRGNQRNAHAPAPVLTDSEYNRLHDIRYDTDLEFTEALLQRWRVRVGRLAPWSADERKSLLRRWYTRASHWTLAERTLFLDSKMAAVPGVKTPAGDAAVTVAVHPVPERGDDPAEVEGAVIAEDDGEGAVGGRKTSGTADSFSLRNSDGSYDSRCFPTLVNMWASRAKRRRPFPKPVADKLLAKWFAHESTWTQRERVIFHADHDPQVEREHQVPDETKRKLLDQLVPRNVDGSVPLLNGRTTTVREKHHEPQSEEAADEVFATPLDTDAEPPASDYEKELKQFLAGSAADRHRRFKLAIKMAVGRKYRMARLAKMAPRAEPAALAAVLFTQPPAGCSFQSNKR